jgi:hypothetical protein
MSDPNVIHRDHHDVYKAFVLNVAFHAGTATHSHRDVEPLFVFHLGDDTVEVQLRPVDA